MSNKNYTPDQIIELTQNPYVSHCSIKSISYTYECKQKILNLYEKEWFWAREAFLSLGFPMYVIHSSLPKNCVKAWKNIVSKKWLIWLKESKRWRKKKEKSSWWNWWVPSQFDELEYLRAKVAYLEEQNKVFKLIRAWKNPW